MSQGMSKVRVGILGAAKIVPLSLIEPASEIGEVEIAALAARDPERAARFAKRYGIARVSPSYEALIADPEIDAIYNPLPNGLHGRWTIAALEAGKHVLCEKPFAANAEEAKAVAEVAHAASQRGLVTMEAFHYRYHALARRMLDIIASGELGQVRHVETWFYVPIPFKNIRWRLDLAGGALMDTGCYTVHLLRTLAGAEPIVRSASAKLMSPGVDRLMRAEFDFADGRTGALSASLLSARLFSVGARVVGSEATMTVNNPVMPQYFNSITLSSANGKRKENVAKRPASYTAQLQAFADAVLRGTPFPTGVDDAVANMRVIDSCYAAAGLPRREPTR